MNNPMDDNYFASVARELERRTGVHVRYTYNDREYSAGSNARDEVSIGRKLLEILDRDELMAVMAHEVGHTVRSDTPALYAYLLVAISFMVMIPAILLSVPTFLLVPELGRMLVDTAFITFGFAIIVSVASRLLGVARRQQDVEFFADDYAKRHVGGEPLVTSLRKLSGTSHFSIDRKVRVNPLSVAGYLGLVACVGASMVLIGETHPDTRERIERLMR